MPLSFLRLADPMALPAALKHPVVAIGNFDGVHLGHQSLFAEAIALGRRLGRPAAALTFDPHPRAFFRPDAPSFRLTPPDLQAERFAAAGLAGAITLTFDAALAGQPAEAFVDDTLIGRLGIAGVVVGADFHFGKGRGGTPEFLKEMAAQRGFVLRMVDQVFLDGAPVSSTRVRAALEAGDPLLAARLLGYPFTVRGPVLHGAKRGRTLSYPTANMALEPGCRLRQGVYAVHVTIDGARREGVASFGSRPMFDNGAALLETHVFDFSGDLYGKTIEVALVHYLRPEATFTDVDALIRQMDADSVEARALLAATKI